MTQSISHGLNQAKPLTRFNWAEYLPATIRYIGSVPTIIPPLFSKFDRISIVNMPHRADRRRQMRVELEAVGLLEDARVQFEPAFRADTTGPFRSQASHGCFLTHLRLLTEAATSNERILILQDDCSFTREIHDYEPETFDIFYGGYEATDPANLITSEIIGAHFMGFSVAAARQASDYLRTLLDPKTEPDPVAAAAPTFDPAIRPPIDGSLVWFRRSHPKLRTVFRLLSYQRPSRSDITPSRVDRFTYLRKFVAQGRKLKRRFYRAAN